MSEGIFKDKGVYVSLDVISQFSQSRVDSFCAYIRQYDEKSDGFNELTNQVIDFVNPITIEGAPRVLRKMADAIEKKGEELK